MRISDWSSDVCSSDLRSPDTQLLANVLSAPGLAAVSHLAAARRLKIPGYRDAPPEITVPRGTRLRRSGLIVHESTDLDRCKIVDVDGIPTRSEEHTSELQSLMRTSSAVFCLKKKKHNLS